MSRACSDDLGNSSRERLFDSPDQTPEADFSFSLWREIFAVIVLNEKKALDTFETVEFELEVMHRVTSEPRSQCIIKMQLVAEPGKPARLASSPSENTTHPDAPSTETGAMMANAAPASHPLAASCHCRQGRASFCGSAPSSWQHSLPCNAFLLEAGKGRL